LGSLWPETAAQWLQTQHAPRWQLLRSQTVQHIAASGAGWRLHSRGEEHVFDQIIWASGASVAAKAVAAMHGAPSSALVWAQRAEALAHTAITTVYTHTNSLPLPAPMMALRTQSAAQSQQAQFVFDRGQITAQDPTLRGVWAWVVSASDVDRDAVTQAVLGQAQAQWPQAHFTHLQTVVEKRATFACRPGIERPGLSIAPGLWAAGDYVQGPYPSTLEAAVRSGIAAAQAALKP
jgi:hypothetical protein